MKTLQDPRHAYPRPPHSAKYQPPPGVEKELDPLADQGEQTYVGHGLLEGRRALVTGADSGIGRAVALAYASSKAAIASYTRSLANIVIKQGIRVNAVAPGPVWTPLIPSTLDKEKTRMFGAGNALGRAAQPVELAPLFVFLASAAASYVTGEVYGATGGQMPI